MKRTRGSGGMIAKKRVLTVRRMPRDHSKGFLRAGPLTLPCALGRSGTTIFKREGDGATPVASMSLITAFRRAGRQAARPAGLPVRITREGHDGWCDAPWHGAYNRFVRLPFGASAESLARGDRLYDLVVVLDWNYTRRVQKRGSAIFLHVAKPGHAPTEGCVALAPRDLRRVAPLLCRTTRLVVER